MLEFPLATEHLFAMIPENHTLASKAGVTFSEINSEAAITYHFAILKANREQLLPVIQRIK